MKIKFNNYNFLLGQIFLMWVFDSFLWFHLVVDARESLLNLIEFYKNGFENDLNKDDIYSIVRL